MSAMTVAKDPQNLYERIVDSKAADRSAVNHLWKWFEHTRDTVLATAVSKKGLDTELRNLHDDGTGAFISLIERAAVDDRIQGSVESYLKTSIWNGIRSLAKRYRPPAVDTEGAPIDSQVDHRRYDEEAFDRTRLAELRAGLEPVIAELIRIDVAKLRPRDRDDRARHLAEAAKVILGEESPADQVRQAARQPENANVPYKTLRNRLDKQRSRSFVLLQVAAEDIPDGHPHRHRLPAVIQLIAERQRPKSEKTEFSHRDPS